MFKPPGFKVAKRRFDGADGNVTMMFALAAPLLFLAVAAAIDLSNASVVRSRLNAAADDAALAALTPAMMQQSDAIAQAAVYSMFAARAAEIGSLNGYTIPTVTITHPGNALTRKVQVSYSENTNTFFSQILHTNIIGVGGTSTAQASMPPNIDFYLLLDNSPSMSLPATQAGVTQMQSLTPTQDGGNSCALACHQASTNNTDTMGNLCADKSTPPYPQCTGNTQGQGSVAISNQYCSPDPNCKTSVNNNYSRFTPKSQADDYQMARWNGITLRLDELSSAVTTLLTTANNDQTSGLYAIPPQYRFAAYEMDQPWTVTTTNNLLMSLTTTFQQAWSTASANFTVMEMYANSVGCADSACDSGVGFNDVATNYDNALSDINNKMPAPGQGTNTPGDKPQEVLFFITDGVEDEQNINRLIQPINGNSGTNWCTQIKTRGIKIAILYTEYLPVPSNGFYQSNVAPILPNVPTALQACASPGLYYDASLGSNLGQALATLFNLAAQQAALLN